MTFVYFDHAATTPPAEEVLAAMWQVYSTSYGNPSSLHRFGRQARSHLDAARRQVAAYLGCHEEHIVWTSGGTESNHLAIIGAARARGKGHVLCSAVEHPAVLNAVNRLAEEGYMIEHLPVNADGRVEPAVVAAHLKPETILVSIMAVNNETGTLQPFVEIGRLLRERGIVFHVDAVQAIDILDKPLSSYPVDLMSFSAHKMNGPQGVGWLYIAPGAPLAALQTGGAQERKRRAGTENVAGAVGAATALRLAVEQRQQRITHTLQVRNRLLSELQRLLPPQSWVLNSPLEQLAPHIVNLSFPWTDTQTLLMHLDLEGIAVSGGSACSSGSLQPSHVLTAMNKPTECIRSAVRFSFGQENTLAEADRVAAAVHRLHTRLLPHGKNV